MPEWESGSTYSFEVRRYWLETFTVSVWAEHIDDARSQARHIAAGMGLDPAHHAVSRAAEYAELKLVPNRDGSMPNA